MKYFVLACLCMPLLLFSQTETPPPSLYEVINIQVKPGQATNFEAAVKSHNAQYHPQGAHFADLFFNVNGPNGGAYSWIMGPTNWAALDNRPAAGGHDDDWANNVGQYIETGSSPQYWNGNPNLSHIAGDNFGSKAMLWLFDIKEGKAPQFAELIGKVKKVYEANRPTETFLFAWNAFANADGQDAVMVWPMNKWAELDDQRDFGKEYEVVHGPGSWHNFLNQIDECVKGRVDWLRENVD